MAPLVKEFEKHRNSFLSKVCITAQHREMLDQVLTIFDIHPDYDLNIMQAGQDLYDITSRVLTGMRDVLSEFKPDLVLVHGDTTTSSSSALAAFYQQIPVGHVEAGLRTGNIYAPWPEEMNRMLTRCLTRYHFSPTETSKQNLLKENVPDAELVLVSKKPLDVVPKYMNACDVLVLVSDGEGSPMVIKEAMACNLPIVSVPVGDVPEVIGGTDGCFLCSQEPGDVAKKL